MKKTIDEERNIITLEFGNQNIPLPTESKNTSDSTFVNWGLNNYYPAFLLELYSQSATHSAIVNQKTNYIIGNGLKLDGTGDLNIQINPSDSLTEFTAKVIKDYLIFNSFAVEVVFNVFGVPIQFFHVPVHKIRLNKLKTKFWYCDDWMYSRKYITYDRYSISKNSDSTSKIFYFDGWFPSVNNIYPTPEYNGTLKSIVTDIAIKEFNLNNIKNHFSPSTIITFFNGANVSEEVKKSIVDEIDNKFKGESGKKFIIDFQTNDGKSAEINQLSANDWDKAYIQVSENNLNDIMIGHQVQSPELFAIQTPGKLGNTQSLEISYEIFKSNYIQVKRAEIESALNQLFSDFDSVSGKVQFSDKPLFNTQLKDEVKVQIYTINELRDIAGLPPLVDGDRLLNSTGDLNTGTKPTGNNGLTEVAQEANDNIKNLTGRQHQAVMRIVRQFLNGKMTLEQAGLMLKSGYGFTDEEVNIFLGIDSDEFEDVKKKSRILEEDDYEQIKHLGSSYDDFEVIEELAHKQYKFDKESDIAQYIIDNDIKGLTLDELVDVLKNEGGISINSKQLDRILNKLNDSGVITVETDGDGKIQVTPVDMPEVPDSARVRVMYQYKKRPEVSGGDLIPTSRSFCKKLIENNRLYSREEIQTMSSIFGYDVFQFAGGWYLNPETNIATPHCRHYWQSLKVKPRN